MRNKAVRGLEWNDGSGGNQGELRWNSVAVRNPLRAVSSLEGWKEDTDKEHFLLLTDIAVWK